jgi:ppGpp synthetase/RelA/SpoT-type nucleotidyltranferase
MWLQVLFESGGAPAGTVHVWSDGNKYQKTTSGTWVPQIHPYQDPETGEEDPSKLTLKLSKNKGDADDLQNHLDQLGLKAIPPKKGLHKNGIISGSMNHMAVVDKKAYQDSAPAKLEKFKPTQEIQKALTVEPYLDPVTKEENPSKLTLKLNRYKGSSADLKAHLDHLGLKAIPPESGTHKDGIVTGAMNHLAVVDKKSYQALTKPHAQQTEPPKPSQSKSEPSQSKSTEPPSDTSIQKLKQAVLAKKLAPHMSVEDHINQAHEVIDKHHARFKETMLDMHHLAPPGARIEGRVKKIDSLLEKLPRKSWQFKRPRDVPDTTGIRIICKNLKEVLETEQNVNDQYHAATWDYLNDPLGDWNYRSLHLYFHDKDGLKKELQIRTENQDKFANWCHNLYKPKTPQELAALEDNQEEIDNYARDMSDHFWNLDNGHKSDPPICPDSIKHSFGCLE